MADIFISYARKDQSRVEPLVEALKKNKWSVWWDREITAGNRWRKSIEREIESARSIIVVWSETSIESNWVMEEAQRGLKRGIVVPVFIDKNVRQPLGFGEVQAVDLAEWKPSEPSSAFDKLIADLSSILGKALVYAPRGGYELVRIPGGEFLMGSPDSEEDHDKNEGPQHQVRVLDFYMGRYPVTNEEYGRFLEEDPEATEPEYWGDRDYNHPRQPVVGASWKDAKQYAQWAGLQLPSEAQWEYACRADTQTMFYSGDTEEDLDRVGWYYENSGFELHPVGEKKPNAFGLYDMHGNVDEWVEDDFHKNYQGAPLDGSAWIDTPRGSDRVFRGGGWNVPAEDCRSAFRGGYDPDFRNEDLGFRLVLLPRSVSKAGVE
jgi:formylglycine-generating enzyme required for sulfatase activity